MPNTEPLDDGDDAGGQLKPIAQFLAPRPMPQSAAPAPAQAAAPPVAPTATAQHAPQAPSQAPQAPAAAPHIELPPTSAQSAPRRLVTTLRAPGLMLHRQQTKEEAAKVVAQAHASVVRTTPFTDEQLDNAWQSFIESHYEQRILVNTMRVSRPVKGEKGYQMTVENEDQVKIVTEAMPEIIKFIGDHIKNDTIHIEILSNAGESSPLTWNERQVLRHIADNNPEFIDFFKSLKLQIN